MDGIRAVNRNETDSLISILKCLSSAIRSSSKIFIGSRDKKNWVYKDRCIYYTIKSIYIPISLVSNRLTTEVGLDMDSIIRILKGGRVHMKRIVLDTPTAVLYLKGVDVECIKVNYRNFRLATTELQI